MEPPPPPPEEAVLQVTLDGKHAKLVYHQGRFYVVRDKGKERSSSQDGDAVSPTLDLSYPILSAPLLQVLHVSFVPDADGGELFVRVLPSYGKKSPSFSPYFSAPSSSSSPSLTHPSPSQSAPIVGASSSSDERRSLNDTERGTGSDIRAEVEARNMRLVKIEARVVGEAALEKAPAWVDEVMRRAYEGVAPRKRLKVLVNPVGGPGKAKMLFETKVRPILDAAQCRLDITYTTHRNHGYEIAAELPIDQFDAVVCVSGDGILHEVLNGFASRKDAKRALNMPVCPVPTGSGNALALNLFGPEQGFNLALACLTVIKGRPFPLDLCSVTQGDRRSYSFLSQTIGLVADCDLGTEHLRSFGDMRFIIGYVQGVLAKRECDVILEAKVRDTRKLVMRNDVRKQRMAAACCNEAPVRDGDNGSEQGGEEGMPGLAHGTVSDPLPAQMDEMSLEDPDLLPGQLPDQVEGTKSAASPSRSPTAEGLSNSDGATSSSTIPWTRFSARATTIVGGTLPYLSRDGLEFPFAIPGDGLIDLCILLADGGRMAKLKVMDEGSTGMMPYHKLIRYYKVEAYRVTPRHLWKPMADDQAQAQELATGEGEGQGTSGLDGPTSTASGRSSDSQAATAPQDDHRSGPGSPRSSANGTIGRNGSTRSHGRSVSATTTASSTSGGTAVSSMADKPFKPPYQGGLLSIDGERFPYEPFQVEAHKALAKTLSLWGRFALPEKVWR